MHTIWKCPQDGMEWAVTERKCPTCGYVNLPKCVTHYNGDEIPPEGCELTDGGVITVGRSRMKLVVKFK